MRHDDSLIPLLMSGEGETKSLDTLFRYHFQENHLPLGRTIAIQQFFLLLFASAGFLYAQPAADLAKHETWFGLSEEAQADLNIAGTCFAACIVLCSAAIMFYQMHVQPQYVPAELNGVVMAPFTPAEYRRKNTIIGSFSLLSAIPFGTVTWAVYKESLNIVTFSFLLAYILLANFFLHFLPLKLLVDHELYGAPARFLKEMLLRITGQAPTSEEILALQQVQAEYIKRMPAIFMLDNAVTHYLDALSKDLTTAGQKLSKITSLEVFLQEAMPFYTAYPQLAPRAVGSARATGVVLVMLSCLGYLANPYIVINDMLHSTLYAILATSIPIVLFGTLLAYFGDYIGERILMDTMLQKPWSVAFKLYPEITNISIMVNLFLLIFSAAAAKEMMRVAFGDTVPLWGINVLAFGVYIVTLYTPIDYLKIVLSYRGQYLDGGPRSDIMVFHEKAEAFKRDLFRSTPELAEQLIEKVQENMPASPKTEEVSSSVRKWCSWCYVNPTEPKQQLSLAKYDA